MNAARLDAYLARLGRPDVSVDAAGLARLQAAHLMAVPFHNLLLVANDGQPWELPSLPTVIDAAIAGVGGNCDRTTPPFTALLQALGFEAHLAAATVRAPGDHFVCVARVGADRFLCDVGNGHPYLRPWRLDGPAQTQSFRGWDFSFDPQAPAGPTLTRRLPDGALKTVYVVEPGLCAYADFAPMVRAHYSEPGFGPFLASLRAVRIHADAVLTLRDAVYTRDTRVGRTTRRVGGREGLQALLSTQFNLPADLVGRALDALHRHRPELLLERRWFALGRGQVSESMGVAPPGRDEVPDVLVSLATVGRVASVQRLLASLAREVSASRYPGHVGVLIVENHAPATQADDVQVGAAGSVVVHRVPLDVLRPALDRAAENGVIPPVGDRLPVPIGVAREAQVAALRAHLAKPVPGLPHPAERPIVVWMVDDDMAFEQRDAAGRVGRQTNLLFRVARFWAELPQHSVILGTYTGDPPVPGLDCLGGQLGDLAANIARMRQLGPDAGWLPPDQRSAMFDAYYDLTEAIAPEAGDVWPYAPHRAGEPVRTVALGLIADLARLLDGQQLTRQLVWDGAESTPRPSLRRGGNTVFLDLDALFRWPTPVLATADGVTTRRADTVWAALARADEPSAVVEATLPLHHNREQQTGWPFRTAIADAARQTASQVRGVALARAVAEARSLDDELPAREARVIAQRRGLRVQLARLRSALGELMAWGDPEVEGAITSAGAVLDALEELASASEPLPGDPRELGAFLARLPEAVRAWRSPS